MITKFKIYEYNSDNENVIDMGYSIYLYRSIFFKKTPKQTKRSVQFDINGFFRTKGDYLTRKLIYAVDNHVVANKLSISHYFQHNYSENKLIVEMKKKNLMEQITIIHELINKLEDDHGQKLTKEEENIYNFIEKPEIRQAFDILDNYYEVDGFNMDLGHRLLGKTIEETKEEIDRFYIEQEMDKYNL